MEKTHAEMQRYHYQAVREHPEYRIIGLLDCEAELRGLDTPAQPDLSDIEDRLSNLEAISAEPGSIPRWYHDQIQQMRYEITNLKMQAPKPRPQKPKPQRVTTTSQSDHRAGVRID